jgi:hypothetical protein
MIVRYRELKRILITTVCAIASTLAISATKELALTFNPSHGVVLSGTEAESIAELCGGTTKPNSWTLDGGDIDRLEDTLAPLLSADLRNSGLENTPREFYRQYATGRLGSRKAIFVNGFHESRLATAAAQARWRSSAMIATDGGDSVWCAVYIEETRQFVKFKAHQLDLHVWFYGLG